MYNRYTNLLLYRNVYSTFRCMLLFNKIERHMGLIKLLHSTPKKRFPQNCYQPTEAPVHTCSFVCCDWYPGVCNEPVTVHAARISA